MVGRFKLTSKNEFVLELAPRFGKTLLVLEYFKTKILRGEYDKDELWLVSDGGPVIELQVAIEEGY